MKIITTLLLPILFVSCSFSGNKSDKTDIAFDSAAFWIGDGLELPIMDSLFYLDDPVPLFRREFDVAEGIKSATLYITAAGYYKATLNGKRIGKDMFEPAWTNFSKRVYYATHDVTSVLEDGSNCLGVMLGNGFYNPLPLRMWGHLNLRNDLPVGRPVFIAKLSLEYYNGDMQTITSDDTWKVHYGPILRNNVFLGEIYDARKEVKGWDTPGFDDRLWLNAKIVDGPGGQLQKAFFPSMQISQTVTPINIWPCPSGGETYIVDMGINFTGIYSIRLSGAEGDSVTLRFGERIYEDGTLNPMTAVCGQIKRAGAGGPGAPDIAWQSDIYIFGEDDIAWYSPEFTYHTFRFMEIAGLKEMPKLSDIIGLVTHNNVPANNRFYSSSELINAIQEMTERTFLVNLISVQADCPAREKFGYGGDLNATSEAYIYNFDMQSFYRKTIYDWLDAMNDSVFVDTAPYVGIRYCGISWESAYLITQYYLYLYYNDTEIVRELYDLNNEWMKKVARIHPNKIVDKGLSDHESLQPVPVQLTGTTHYLKSAKIMQTFAAVMGDKKREKEYGLLVEELGNLVKAEFWDKAVEGAINRQTLFATLRYFNIVPENESQALRDSLISAVKNGPSGHFNTGIFGTKYILDALSSFNATDMVYNIVNSTTYPGWGHMIDRGATTIWETWQESDNTYSNCHPMFGSVTGWFYKWLGGISPDPENPGFRKFFLSPSTPQGLEYVNTSYESPFGTIVSNWRKDEDGPYSYEMKVPGESTAMVQLPVGEGQRVYIQKTDDPDFDAGMIDNLQSGEFELKHGTYTIRVMH